MKTWSAATILAYFDKHVSPLVQAKIAGLFLSLAALTGRWEGNINKLSGGQLVWLQEELIVSVDPMR